MTISLLTLLKQQKLSQHIIDRRLALSTHGLGYWGAQDYLNRKRGNTNAQSTTETTNRKPKKRFNDKETGTQSMEQSA